MEICRKEESIVIKDKDIIEEYKLDAEINFKGLITHLLGLNLAKKVELKCSIDDLSESEKNLVNLIKSIVNDYNEKVEEFEKFKAEN